MTLDDYPVRVPAFTVATCPKGNIWPGPILDLFRELQRRALAVPEVDHWRMMPKGAVVAVCRVANEPTLVLQIQRANVSAKNAVPAFGLEVQTFLREFNVGRQIRTQRIDDRRHEPERRLRWLALVGPKMEVAHAS